LHKYGYGLKFYRDFWARYPEPSYWTVVKYRPKPKEGGKARVWGFRTWRGVTEPLPRLITSTHKREWRVLLEPGTKLGPSSSEYWKAPQITDESNPRDSTQIPEDLKGAKEGTWPYQWGKLGKRPNGGQPVVKAEEQKEAEQKE
jgi:hypothetical protein